jgi:hypothetical protein
MHVNMDYKQINLLRIENFNMKILSVIIGMCLFEIYNFLYAKNNLYKIIFGSIVFILFCICIMFYL